MSVREVRHGSEKEAEEAGHEVCVGYFSPEEIRREGLSCVFEESLCANGRQLNPLSGKLHELLNDTRIVYLLVDLSGWQERRQILEAIHRTRKDLRLIVIGPDDEELALRSLRAGARAYVDHTAPIEVVRQAVVTVVEGSVWVSRRLIAKMLDHQMLTTPAKGNASNERLTERERQVLELILSAHSNREIGQQLGIEERTVKAHVSRLMRKTGAENRVGLSVRALGNVLPASMELLGQVPGERREFPRK